MSEPVLLTTTTVFTVDVSSRASSMILDEKGKELKDEEKGYIAYKKPWPGMFLTLNNDPDRYKKGVL